MLNSTFIPLHTRTLHLYPYPTELVKNVEYVFNSRSRIDLKAWAVPASTQKPDLGPPRKEMSNKRSSNATCDLSVIMKGNNGEHGFQSGLTRLVGTYRPNLT